MADLAGNEDQRKSGAKDDIFKEASEINCDLTDLKSVIEGLSNLKAGLRHKPTRELTKYLNTAFQPNSKTVMLAHVTREKAHEKQTEMTLKLAMGAFKVHLKEQPTSASSSY